MINFLYRFLEKVTKIKNNIYIKKYEQLSKVSFQNWRID